MLLLIMIRGLTSTNKMHSNQVRLYFSSIAYVMVQALRRLGLAGTKMAKAQCDTIRLRLFKIGARIRITVRKVWIAYAGGYPYRCLFAHILMNLMKIPLRI